MHCPLPQSSAVVKRSISTVHCHKALRRCARPQHDPRTPWRGPCGSWNATSKQSGKEPPEWWRKETVGRREEPNLRTSATQSAHAHAHTLARSSFSASKTSRPLPSGNSAFRTTHHSILVHSTPCHCTPVHTTPHKTTPHHTTPHHTMPHHTTPLEHRDAGRTLPRCIRAYKRTYGSPSTRKYETWARKAPLWCGTPVHSTAGSGNGFLMCSTQCCRSPTPHRHSHQVPNPVLDPQGLWALP